MRLGFRIQLVVLLRDLEQDDNKVLSVSTGYRSRDKCDLLLPFILALSGFLGSIFLSPFFIFVVVITLFLYKCC